ncbi:MAG: methionyl-tRNA formyltransferase [Candidatus Magasanikbacteria bacterium]|nr:methionyl-tRNA formyltransferase [Candidatus Magasanikbacteria bacterium]
MSKFNIVFFGTHNFATKILQGLINNPDFNVGLVITQPDQLEKKKKELQSPPVKNLALQNNLKIEQLENLKNFDTDLSKFDVAVVAQYGKIIPLNILELPKKGMINVHASLLPKYRGASPIQFSLLNGDKKTGVTIMKMDEKMDTGPLLAQKDLKIDDNDTYLTLETKLADLATPLLLVSLKQYLNQELKSQPQDNGAATYTKILSREDGKIDLEKTAQQTYNQWRAFYPWPGVFLETQLNSQNQKIKLLKTRLTDNSSNLPPGSFTETEKDHLGLVCGDKKILEVQELQLENKNAIQAREFINGYKINILN